ncbi:MAG: hypothetical protein MJ239_01115 [Bacilli bacterium]|nr:hypothetical protein [Bacilli bacterium]
MSLEGTFEGAVVDEATFERKDLNLGSSKIDVVCGGDVIKSIPITGVCHKIDTPHFLSPVKRHDLIEDSVLLPSSFYADFHGLPGSYWSKDVVLRYQQPLDYEYSVLLKSAADKYELSTKAMVVSDELSKLDKTLFAFFRVSETIVLAFAMFAEVQITVSSLQKKEKGVLTRYFCGMDLFASFSYSLFYCLLSFCVSLLISVLSNILLSIVFTKFLNGKLIGPFFGEFYWQVGVFIAFSIASFITVSAVFSKKTSLLLSD